MNEEPEVADYIVLYDTEVEASEPSIALLSVTRRATTRLARLGRAGRPLRTSAVLVPGGTVEAAMHPLAPFQAADDVH